MEKDKIKISHFFKYPISCGEILKSIRKDIKYYGCNNIKIRIIDLTLGKVAGYEMSNIYYESNNR